MAGRHPVVRRHDRAHGRQHVDGRHRHRGGQRQPERAAPRSVRSPRCLQCRRRGRSVGTVPGRHRRRRGSGRGSRVPGRGQRARRPAHRRHGGHRRGRDPHLRPGPGPVPHAARSRPHQPGRDDGPDRRQGPRRVGAGRGAPGADPADHRRGPGGEPGPGDARRQLHVHQRRHHRADLGRPGRVAQADDPAHVHHPAVRVRRDRGLGRAAGPRGHLTDRRLRDARHLQPARRSGECQRDATHRAHRARRRRRLLPVHDHPVPGGTTGRPRPRQGDRGLEQHGRPGRLLLGARGDDLAGGPRHAGRVAVHVDGGRDHLGRRSSRSSAVSRSSRPRWPSWATG